VSCEVISKDGFAQKIKEKVMFVKSKVSGGKKGDEESDAANTPDKNEPKKILRNGKLD
jgi:hypothetical protein